MAVATIRLEGHGDGGLVSKMQKVEGSKLTDGGEIYSSPLLTDIRADLILLSEISPLPAVLRSRGNYAPSVSYFSPNQPYSSRVNASTPNARD